MQDKLKSLTWKYFWQQKLKEIGLAIFLPYLIGGFFFSSGDIISRWGIGFIIIILSCVVIFMVLSLLIQFVKWNWEKASKRAKEELKRK